MGSQIYWLGSIQARRAEDLNWTSLGLGNQYLYIVKTRACSQTFGLKSSILMTDDKLLASLTNEQLQSNRGGFGIKFIIVVRDPVPFQTGGACCFRWV